MRTRHSAQTGLWPATNQAAVTRYASSQIENTEMPFMRIQFRIRGLNATASLRAWLAQQLEHLRSLMPVSTADVMLERQRDGAPAFRAQVHLAVPGPDIHAEACDHTLQAAWLKVAKKLRQQITQRKTQQQLRHKGQAKHPLTASRWSGAPIVAQT